MSGGALRLNRKDSMQDWMESRGFTPLYFFVAITEILFVAIIEKIVSMKLRPVFDWGKRQIFR